MGRNRNDNIREFNGYRSEDPISLNSRRTKGSGSNAPAYIGAAVFALVFIYLCINLYIYWTKDQVSIYEVQAEALSFDTSFDAVILRNEKLIESAYSGYVTYYIDQGSKASKNSVVYSVDASSDSIYSQINSDYDNIIYDTAEINQIKSAIAIAMRDYDGSDLTWADGFSDNLTDKVYEIVNSNLLERAMTLQKSGSGNSDFHSVRVPESGVISYKTDSLFGITDADITGKTFEKKNFSEKNLKTGSLMSKGEFVFRLCPDEAWSVVAHVSEDFYVNNLENRTATVYIDGSAVAMKGDLKLFRRDDDYFAEVSLNDCLVKYIDDRFVKVEFTYDTENGLKIPLSAVVSKEYFLVPLTMFTVDEGYDGYVLKRELYDAETGTSTYDSIYTSKYFSDGYYAYLDKSLVNDGDYLVNTLTNERYRVGSVNMLDGVYCVNKGYYVFTRIERIKSNSEYVIVKKNTAEGLRLYDHIALNSSDAVEGKIIY